MDPRLHLESSWKRQEKREGLVLEQAKSLHDGIAEVHDLEGLEALVQAAGPRIVVVFMYSRTCGVCKIARERFQELAQQARSQKARVAFLQHNVLDDYDLASDIARMYKVKVVPCFLFFDEGAVVERISLRDIRMMRGSKETIQGAISEDARRLKRVFWQVILRCAPSARS